MKSRALAKLVVTAAILAVALPSPAAALDEIAIGHSVTADLAGDGSQVTAVVRRRGTTIRLEVRDAGEKRLASADVPSPGTRDARFGVSAGPLGSVGALLAVSAAGGGRDCVSVWRFRGGVLTRLPLVAGGRALENCSPAGEWSVRWDGDGSQRPAAFVRERWRSMPGGVHRQSDVFVFSGFQLERDPRRSRSQIREAVIPSWFSAELYPRSALDRLAERFDLSALKKGPRLTIEADPEGGRFDLRFRDETGDLRLPVVRSSERDADGEPGVELTAGGEAASVRASVGLRNKSIPYEVRVTGTGSRFDEVYSPALDFQGERIEVYPSAEQAIASGVLPGTWSNEENERWDVRVAPGDAVVDWGGGKFAVRLRGTPGGSDLLLLPAKDGEMAWAIALKGPNALARRRVHCGSGAAGEDCRADGPEEVLRRLGSAMNVR